MVIRGMLNLSLVSGQDTTSLLGAQLSGGLPPMSAGQGAGGIGSATTGVLTLLKARVDTVNQYFIF
jgi:hypothetical protein